MRVCRGDRASRRGLRRGARDLSLQHARAHDERRDGKVCVSRRPQLAGCHRQLLGRVRDVGLNLELGVEELLELFGLELTGRDVGVTRD